MKNSLIEIINYIIEKHQPSKKISLSRLIKTIYLADWKESITNRKQITNIEWFSNLNGPYNSLILKESEKEKSIKITTTLTESGKKQTILEATEEKKNHLDAEIIKILDFVIEATKNKKHIELIKLVSSTYPVISSEKFHRINLIEKAEEYKEYLDNTEIP
ncbi:MULTISPECIES: type II toxin-antitoxin system antitoxin SocA domain-containing protein [unclassified Pseudomonas]|uniref:type II toxin-antitoxin system antitoxin SocA domain-containing protein n=1 Tax=unclassified Pseudomonas TaxID=196821 RepID=UPI003265CB8B